MSSKIKISASQLISNMICRNYDNNKMFGLLQFHSGYVNVHLNSPTGYSQKIINAQTGNWESCNQFDNTDRNCKMKPLMDVSKWPVDLKFEVKF